MDFDNVYTYHAPTPAQIDRYAQIRAAGKDLAMLIARYTPASREQSLALTKLQETVMWANAAIAINETDAGGR